MNYLPTFLLLVGLLCGCPGDPASNNVATPADTGSVPDVGPGDDVGSADAAPDVAPDLPAEPGSLVIEPRQLTFDDVRQGESRTQSIAISNVGGQPLVVSRAALIEFNRAGEPELRQGDGWEESFVVGAGLFTELDVVYEPKDFDIDQGEVELFTNDPENEMVTIRIQTVSAYADLQGPQFLRFGGVAVGDEADKRIILSNRGLDPLTISNVELGGISMAFSLTFEPTSIPPTVLEKDEDFVMDVTYAPLNSDTDRGTITVTSDDPDDDVFEIALTGNDPVPCMDLSPQTLDFGRVPPGAEQTESVVILNCSRNLDLEISAIEFRDDGGGAFSLPDAPELPLGLAPLETTELSVAGSLADAGVATGELKITSDDPKSTGQLGIRLKAAEQ